MIFENLRKSFEDDWLSDARTENDVEVWMEVMNIDGHTIVQK